MLVAVPISAVADTKVVEDADDTQGVFDIASVSHGHTERLLLHTMTMYEAWENAVLADDSTYVTFTFYYGRGNFKFITVDVAPDGSLFAEIVRWDGETVVGYAKVWRPDDRTLQIEFPKRALQRGLNRYSWDAHAVYRGPAGSECADPHPCNDEMREANTKFIVHRLN